MALGDITFGGANVRVVTIVVAILILFSVHGNADNKNELKAGDHLRIRMTGAKDKYVLDRIRPDTLYVYREHDNEFQQIVFGQIEKIEVKVPRSSGSGALRGALIGGGIGGVIGMLYAVATWDDVNTDCGQYNELCSNTASGLRFMGSVAVFGMPGMLLGAVIGAAVPGEHWQQIDLAAGMSLRIDSRSTLLVQYSKSF